MKVILLRQAAAPASGWLTALQWIEQTAANAKKEPKLTDLLAEVEYLGPQGTVLCPPEMISVATSRRAFPDRRIEVDAKYRDPQPPKPQGGGIKLPAFIWQRRFALRHLLGQTETPEALKRRVIETTAKLIELAKKDGASVLVGEGLLLRLVMLKLKSIGFIGPVWPALTPGKAVSLEFEETSPKPIPDKK